nr:SDR family oxidoreductase [Streptacidiphilus pinicola]
MPDGHYLQGDIADPADAERLVEQTVKHYGRLDVLVNNAGTTRFIPLDDLGAADPQAWREIFDVNVIGAWQLTVAAVPHLRAGGAGSVVNSSSVSATRALGNSIPYAVSKATVNHMTRLLASQLGPEIRVNAVAPGLIDTAWYAEADQVWQSSRDWIAAHTPLHRAGTPEDVADAVAYLVDAAHTTGDSLTVDGGRHIV